MTLLGSAGFSGNCIALRSGVACGREEERKECLSLSGTILML